MPSDWFIQKVRARPNKLENLRVFWESAGWKVAMGMRSGQSFGDASSEVMTDVDLLTEAMSCEVPKETKPAAPKKRSTGISPERQPGAMAPTIRDTMATRRGASTHIPSTANRRSGKQDLGTARPRTRAMLVKIMDRAARDSTGLSNAHWRYPAHGLANWLDDS